MDNNTTYRKIQYHKLIRDNLLEIMKNEGEKPEYKVLDNEELITNLYDKLFEEVFEFKSTPNEEEMADILTVLDAIKKIHNLDDEKIQEIKEQKYNKKGGFEKGYFCEYTLVPENSPYHK